MNKYLINIIETQSVDYVVEAETQAEALHLFSYWVDANQMEVAHRLDRNSNGWEFTYPEKTDYAVDITRAELLSAAAKEEESNE